MKLLFEDELTLDEFEKLKLNHQASEEMAKAIIQECQLPEAPLTHFSEGTNIVFGYGEDKVIKIYPPFHHDQFTSDLLVMKHLEGKLPVKTPTIECAGEFDGWPYIIMTKLPGTLLETLWETLDHSNKIVIIRELGALIREVHSFSTHGLEEIDCHWEQFIENQIDHCVERHRSKDLPDSLVHQIPPYIESVKESLSQIKNPVILTGEYTPMNFLVKQVDGVWHIDGLIDFGDAMLGRAEYDLLGPGAFLIQGDKQLLREFLAAYGYSPSELLSHHLMALMLLHKYSNLNVQVRIEDWQNKVHSLQDLENLVWGF